MADGTPARSGFRATDRLDEARRTDLNEPWPLTNESVDVLHSNQVIEHLPRTDHFMPEVRRVLRPGGYALVSTNNLASCHNIVSLVLGLQPPPCHVSDRADRQSPVPR